MSPGTREQRQQQEKQTEKSLAIERERERGTWMWMETGGCQGDQGRQEGPEQEAGYLASPQHPFPALASEIESINQDSN